MAELQKEPSQQPVLEKEKAKELGKLEDNLNALVKYGKFDAFKGSIRKFTGSSGIERPGLENLDPDRKARKNIFLSESKFKEERKQLRSRLEMIQQMLSKATDMAELVNKIDEDIDKTSALLKANLGKALETSLELEKSYRALASFYANAEKSKGAKTENISLLNAGMDNLTDLEVGTFLKCIAEELEKNYNNLDLKNNYSMFVVPGYLGDNKTVSAFAKAALRNKVMLFTDFRNLESVEDVIEIFSSEGLTGSDLEKAYVTMACNWVVARKAYTEYGEKQENLFLPPSAALAGKVFRNPIQQVSAGARHGGLAEIEGVRFGMKATEIGDIEELGLIPVVAAYGKVFPMSAKTLFNGDNDGLRTYSVVRTFDYISKNIKQMLNKYTFQNISSDMLKEIRSQILKFLEDNKGENRLIKDFQSLEVVKVGNDKVRINVKITPYFPARVFEINLTGLEGADRNSKEWEENVTQK